MIKLSGKAKLLVPIGIAAAALAAGFAIDRLHQTRFRVERLKPGDVNDYAVIVTDAPEAAAEKVNINTATVEQLTSLDGIGESIAQNIVSYREETGDFVNVDELLNISGIGESKLEDIRDRVCVQ